MLLQASPGKQCNHGKGDLNIFLFVLRTDRNLIEIFPPELMFEGFDYLLLVADEQKRTAVFTTQLPEKGKRLLAVFSDQGSRLVHPQERVWVDWPTPLPKPLFAAGQWKAAEDNNPLSGTTPPGRQILGPSLFTFPAKKASQAVRSPDK